MEDYEHIVISAVRYALGRMTYIVGITVNYILNEIEEDKLSDRCLSVIRDVIIEYCPMCRKEAGRVKILGIVLMILLILSIQKFPIWEEDKK